MKATLLPLLIPMSDMAFASMFTLFCSSVKVVLVSSKMRAVLSGTIRFVMVRNSEVFKTFTPSEKVVCGYIVYLYYKSIRYDRFSSERDAVWQLLPLLCIISFSAANLSGRIVDTLSANE